MNKEKQIEEMAKDVWKASCAGHGIECTKCEYANNSTDEYSCVNFVISQNLYKAGYRKQNEECEKRIANQREEIRRLHMRVNALSQSREVWKQQADRVGKQLHEVLNKQAWISVKEALPIQWDRVLVFCDGIVTIDYIASNGRWHAHFIHDNVTHWMPLPEPPKGGADSGAK